MSLTLQDVKQIQADAAKAVNRQFRDAAEDQGWEPTPTPADDSVGLIPEADTEHVLGTDDEPRISDLRAKAKELGLSGGGSKQELVTRIDEHLASQEGDK